MFDLEMNEKLVEVSYHICDGMEGAYRMAIGRVWEPVLDAMSEHTTYYKGDVMHDAMALLMEMREMDESGERPLEEQEVYTVGVRKCGVDWLPSEKDIHKERYPGGIFHITLQYEPLSQCYTSITQVTFRTYKEVSE